nr:MAG TPA: hypothetical protein [Caudoviricetes sp.]
MTPRGRDRVCGLRFSARPRGHSADTESAPADGGRPGRVQKGRLIHGSE